MRVAVLLFLVLAACQASPPHYQLPNGTGAQLSLRADATFDVVWQTIVETFAKSTTSIETIEKASGFIAAARPVDFAGVDQLAALVDFGNLEGVVASSWVQARQQDSSARVRYNVFVLQGAAQQEVHVNTAWTGRLDVNRYGGNGPVSYHVDLAGNSTGLFERRLLEAIAAGLGSVRSEIVVTKAFEESKYVPAARMYGESSEGDGWVKNGN